MSNLWTGALEEEFHGCIQKLRDLTQVPSNPIVYCEAQEGRSCDHVLSLKHELHIADGLAYLCHWDEGVEMVSAVTIQEHCDGLTILIKSNSTPSPSVVAGLRRILAIANQLLDEVVQLDERRILSRVRPAWLPKASHIRGVQLFLGDRILRTLTTIRKQYNRFPQVDLFLKEAQELVVLLSLLKHRTDGSDRHNVIKTVVRQCAVVARFGGNKSVEDHLKALELPSRIAEAPEIRQVDKLARYWLFCQDLIRIARRPQYTALFSQIRIVPLEAFPGLDRPGLRQQCFVHAEMQQIIHYERHPHRPSPRAIGCSKSACYLCDMFITKQGIYHVSSSHRRLYEKWTIPDINWMTADQVAAFRTIIQDMMKVMRTKERSLRATRVKSAPPSHPMESRSGLPLSNGSTPSQMTVAATNRPGSEVISELLPMLPSPLLSRSVMATTEFQSACRQLPFFQQIQNQSQLDIRIGEVSLCFEFSPGPGGQLFISKVATPPASNCRVISVTDIPIDHEITLAPQERSKISFQLHHGEFALQIEFVWGSNNSTANPDSR
ncbi:hypothetical protein EV126DRAFT_342566 [Verticillium dahliae]|nr:hypothetical protein EV126DRAFT_342566 [Verticillium dahliae]